MVRLSITFYGLPFLFIFCTHVVIGPWLEFLFLYLLLWSRLTSYNLGFQGLIDSKGTVQRKHIRVLEREEVDFVCREREGERERNRGIKFE